MTHLKVGDKAPDIQIKDHSGNDIKLSDYKGSKVVIYFYPRDNTPGCTAEACNLRDNYAELLKRGFKILGVSKDSDKSHVNFADKYSLPFPLLPDVDKKIIIDYGVWGPKKFMGKVSDGVHRTTFVISEEGLIERIFEKVDTKNHTQQIIETY